MIEKNDFEQIYFNTTFFDDNYFDLINNIIEVEKSFENLCLRIGKYLPALSFSTTMFDTFEIVIEYGFYIDLEINNYLDYIFIYDVRCDFLPKYKDYAGQLSFINDDLETYLNDTDHFLVKTKQGVDFFERLRKAFDEMKDFKKIYKIEDNLFLDLFNKFFNK